MAEISNLRRGNFMFPYHIEIECPSTFCDLESDHEMKRRCAECVDEENAYQLTERKWCIRNGDEVENIRWKINGDPFYPKVFVNQKRFEYELCSHQKRPTDGEMSGFFVFHRNAQDPQSESFELELKPYTLDWNKCQWI